jgi:hypothetical protein
MKTGQVSAVDASAALSRNLTRFIPFSFQDER